MCEKVDNKITVKQYILSDKVKTDLFLTGMETYMYCLLSLITLKVDFLIS